MPFTNPVMGGKNLVRTVMQSPNYEPGVSGWAIFQDGSAEFNNLAVRGVFNGINYVIDSSGIFFYG